jgi:hypothetical protein
MLIAGEVEELDEETTRELCARVRCPVLVIQGTEDAITGKGCGTAPGGTPRGETNAPVPGTTVPVCDVGAG